MVIVFISENALQNSVQEVTDGRNSTNGRLTLRNFSQNR